MSSRLISQAFRAASKASFARVATRSAVAVPKFTAVRAFSISARPQNSAFQSVSDNLKAEIELEVAELESSLPENLQQYISDFNVKIVESKGDATEHELIRETANEVIHVFFNVDHFTNSPFPDQDPAEEGAELEQEGPELASVNVVIVKKADNTAFHAEMLYDSEGESFIVDSAAQFENSADALSNSLEADYKRKLSYRGPEFATLDENLQEAIENYLVDRRIDQELGLFLTEYSLYKENVMYVNWLKNLKKFF
ncbi:hypothetical protein BABINDRAFT_161013 [Babjeviella inositovora NRRL Y-12698]|uniref:Mitochondrial glyco protein n=1 Tax=Babjeviella inositovora NRRL Y-12698 TaxID=984486 RepID=A0A1E3QTF0_9ASCO|nr:uncharacterized protein BABINDRAFT_161013 [Babjeviella inositovora NRRL Y-12698]ODQ80804.1 hypothetical protein BABINDRAFT_161013 [Babjeviella inositovora NRRL Y-12698]